MGRFCFVLAALVTAAALVYFSSGNLDALEEEVERAENYIRGPRFDPSKQDRIEWQIPSSELVISEGLVEVFLSHGLHGPKADGERPRTWTVEAYTLGEDGAHYDAMLHPVGSESHGPRTFSFTTSEEDGDPHAPHVMAYLSGGAPLYVAVEVVEADPALGSGTVEITAAPMGDPAAPGIVGLVRTIQRAIQVAAALALLSMCVLYFRSSVDVS